MSSMEFAHLIGTRWRINDTGSKFVVIRVDGRYAYVLREGRRAEGRILAHRIKDSRQQTGYTRLGAEAVAS